MASTASVNSTNSVRRKLAMIIGIGDYNKGKNIPNAINDAKDVAATLKRIGFIIHENGPQLNLTYKKMSNTLASFQRSVQAGDMVLFYFAGHGKQWEDQNYLIPSDNYKDEGKIKTELSGPDLSYHAINAQHFLDSITTQNPFVTIFFLDCCRIYHLRNEHLIYSAADQQNNDSQRFRSIPANIRSIITNPTPMIPKGGFVIAFACAPGTTADDGKNGEINGLFTKHILRYISKPNEDIRMILSDVTDGVIEESGSTQIPFVTCSLRDRNICLYELVTAPSETRRPDSEVPSLAQKYNRPPTFNTMSPSSTNKGQSFKTSMNMMSTPSRSEDGRLMDEDGYYNEDGSRSWV